MPPAVLVPIAIAGASLVAGNVANKAAAKNNQNQQTGAVQNAKQAEQTAATQAQQLIASNPSPFAGQTVAQPKGGGYAGAPPSSSPPAMAASGANPGGNVSATNPVAQAILRSPTMNGSVSPIAGGGRVALPGAGQQSAAAPGTMPANPSQNPIIARILASAGVRT